MNILTKVFKIGNGKFVISNIFQRGLLTCSISKNKENRNKQINDGTLHLIRIYIKFNYVNIISMYAYFLSRNIVNGI